MLHSSDAEDWLKRGLCEAILVLCKSGLKFQSQFSINGLLAITVDQREVFLINIKETVGHSPEPLSFNEDSTDERLDRPCGNFTATIANQPRCANSSRKLNLKRKNSEKIMRRDSGQAEDKVKLIGLKQQDVYTKTQGVQEEPASSTYPGERADRKGIDVKDDAEGNSVKLDTGEDLPDSRDAAPTNSTEMARSGNDSPGFDLSLVKVEKEEDAYIPLDGHLHQSFHPQLYNSWQSELHGACNGLRSPIGRPGGARSQRHEIAGEDVSDQFGQQFINNTIQQHSTQRRVAREGRCENCGTRKTTAWRRSDLKELLCNACGCYYKLHKYHRPLHMAQNEIKTRCRRNKQPGQLLGLKPQTDQSCLIIRGMMAEINESYFPGTIHS